MATATLPSSWFGRSGREYVPVEGVRIRHGGGASVRKAVGQGQALLEPGVAAGVPCALKLWNEGDEEALDQLQAEAKILIELAGVDGEIPCPRLFDLIGTPMVTGLVMEWCPVNLERWWREKLTEPDALGRLMSTMAEAARRVSDYHVFYASQRGLDLAHGDLKPANILLSMEGRWVISDFGGARSLLDQKTWDESRVIVATDNYLAPELIFNAARPFPAAMDTWSLATTVFALLRMRRSVLDGEPLPRTGTYSPRFRMERTSEVLRIFNRDPTRYFDRAIDPADFDDPLRVPDGDRRAVHDAMRGVLGAGREEQETRLAEELLELLDHATSIDPAHRFTDARALAAAFEQLTRSYLELLAVVPSSRSVSAAPDREVLRLEQEVMDRRVRALQEENQALAEKLAVAMAVRPPVLEEEAVRELVVEAAWRPPLWWGLTLFLLLVLQGTIVAVLALMLVWLG